MKIALIIDGLDSTRQIHADGGKAIQAALSKTSVGGNPIGMDTFLDGQVQQLLETLDQNIYGAILFSSNSLRHPESLVSVAVKNNSTRIKEFLSQGNGIAVLHQFGPNVTQIDLPSENAVSYGPYRRLEKSKFLFSEPLSDPIANFPSSIKDASLEFEKIGQLSRVVSWQKIVNVDLESFEPVLQSSPEEILIAKTRREVPWRGVFSAIPLDWHGSINLLANIIQFIALGVPQCTVWRSESGDSQEFGPHAAIAKLDGSFQATDALSEQTKDWLSRECRLHIITDEFESKNLDHCKKLASAGVAMKIEKVGNESTTNFFGRVSDRSREYAKHAFVEIASLSHDEIVSGDPYPRRNLVVSAEYFSKKFSGLPHSWQPTEDPELISSIQRSNFEGMTATSALANAQTALAAKIDNKFLIKISDQLEDLLTSAISDQALYKAFQCAQGDLSLDEYLDWLTNQPVESITAPDSLRILDWLGFLAFSQGLKTNSAAAAEVFGMLYSAASASKIGNTWLSLEGNTNLILGAFALQSWCTDIDVMDQVSPAISQVRLGYISPDANMSAITRVRLAYCLGCVESMSPLVLDRLTDVLLGTTSVLLSGSLNQVKQVKLEAQRVAVVNRQLVDSNDLFELERKTHKPVWMLGAVFLWIGGLSLFASSLAFGISMGSFLGETFPLIAPPLLAVWAFLLLEYLKLMNKLKLGGTFLVRILAFLPKRGQGK